MNKTIVLRPVPENKITGGFIEIGQETSSGHYEYEDQVDFFLGNDGYVYAQICRLEDLPEAE